MQCEPTAPHVDLPPGVSFTSRFAVLCGDMPTVVVGSVTQALCRGCKEASPPGSCNVWLVLMMLLHHANVLRLSFRSFNLFNARFISFLLTWRFVGTDVLP